MQSMFKVDSAANGWVTLPTLIVACFCCGIEFSALDAAPIRVPDRVLVKPKAGTAEANIQALLAAQGGQQQGAIKQIDVRIVQVPAAKLDAVLDALKHNPHVEFAEPDYLLPPD